MNEKSLKLAEKSEKSQGCSKQLYLNKSYNLSYFSNRQVLSCFSNCEKVPILDHTTRTHADFINRTGASPGTFFTVSGTARMVPAEAQTMPIGSK